MTPLPLTFAAMSRPMAPAAAQADAVRDRGSAPEVVVEGHDPVHVGPGEVEDVGDDGHQVHVRELGQQLAVDLEERVLGALDQEQPLGLEARDLAQGRFLAAAREQEGHVGLLHRRQEVTPGTR